VRKRRLRELTARELRGRRALVRVDYNVPLDDQGEVADPSRVVATFPTLDHLLERGARPVLLSHLGRPGGRPDPDLTLAPVARVLERGFGRRVRFVGSSESEDAVEITRSLEPGALVLMENVRFLAGETSGDPDLARRLARLGELYVNDAFGASHRRHASTFEVARLLRPAVAGLLVEREIEVLDTLRGEPERPFVVVFGGAKIADKVAVIERFLERADRILVGGAMANTFLRAAGHGTGGSLVEEEALDVAGRLLKEGGDRIRLPEDLVAAPEPGAVEEARTVPADSIPPELSALDVGPVTRDRFAEEIGRARTVFWNGPLGLFERAGFAEGTNALARALARATRDGALTVVGGGDTARALRSAGLADRVGHVSTGGGAALEYLAEGRLPAIEVLEDAAPAGGSVGRAESRGGEGRRGAEEDDVGERGGSER